MRTALASAPPAAPIRACATWDSSPIFPHAPKRRDPNHILPSPGHGKIQNLLKEAHRAYRYDPRSLYCGYRDQQRRLGLPIQENQEPGQSKESDPGREPGLKGPQLTRISALSLQPSAQKRAAPRSSQLWRIEAQCCSSITPHSTVAESENANLILITASES